MTKKSSMPKMNGKNSRNAKKKSRKNSWKARKCSPKELIWNCIFSSVLQRKLWILKFNVVLGTKMGLSVAFRWGFTILTIGNFIWGFSFWILARSAQGGRAQWRNPMNGGWGFPFHQGPAPLPIFSRKMAWWKSWVWALEKQIVMQCTSTCNTNGPHSLPSFLACFQWRLRLGITCIPSLIVYVRQPICHLSFPITDSISALPTRLYPF